jgi:hypothetical protein
MKTHSQIIDELGGNIAVAKICHPTLTAVVSGWRKRGIPKGWLAFLKSKRPEVFINDFSTIKRIEGSE